MTRNIYSDSHATPQHPPRYLQRRSSKQADLSWLEEPYNHTRGEMSLWVAVITQAMMDALSKANNAEAIYHKHEATHWLTGNSKDFIMVCLFAGFDPDYIRRKAKRTLIAPTRWRAEAGKGSRYIERKAYRRSKKAPSKPCETKSDGPPVMILRSAFGV
jgi:hypothetical protein